jgi:uncharacterized protein YjbI with pentapeptide repeats
MTAIQAIRTNINIWNKWRNEHRNLKISFKGGNLQGLNLSPWDHENRISDSGADLREIDFSNADLTGADLYGADLQNAKLKNAKLISVNFRRANCGYCDFTNSDLSLSHFYKANINFANFTSAILSGSDFSVGTAKGAKFNQTDLKNIQFENPSNWIIPVPLPDPFALLDSESLHEVNTESQKVAYDYIKDCLFALENIKTYHPDHMGVGFEDVLNRAKALLSIYSETTLPEDLPQVVKNINSELIKYLKKHPHHLHQIHWRTFEELIAELLSSFGWQVELTSPTKDNGYDIFAIFKDNSGIRHNWLVECKKFNESNKVGIDIVRSLYGVKTDLRVGNALLATTSSFTKGVEDFKLSHYDFETKDFKGIVEWINNYKLNKTGSLYIIDNKLQKGIT